MRHLKTGRNLGMNGSHRKATFRNMVDSLIIHGRIKTTVTRAKELRKLADKMIGYAKRDTLHTKRMALQILRTKDAFQKLFSEYKELFTARSGGYTRIIKLGPRKGDNAPMAYIEYVRDDMADDKSKGRKRRRRKKSDETVKIATSTTETTEKTAVEEKVEAKTETKEVKTENKETVKKEAKVDTVTTEVKEKTAVEEKVVTENKEEKKDDTK